MKTIRVAGVPEHFNFPWHSAIEEGLFSDVGIDLQWTDVAEGTGKMCQMLRSNETDVAVVLTEGIVRDIIREGGSKLISTYVESPLIWGIHVASNSDIHSLQDIKGKRCAISRFGSGSHLMAIVNAENNNWPLDIEFIVVDNIDGAVASLTRGDADYFMWEKFMTKPLVDQGIFRRIGECPTPWPCFAIAVSDNFSRQNQELLKNMLEVISDKASEIKSLPFIEEEIAKRYKLRSEDVSQWLKSTVWNVKTPPDHLLNIVQNQLLQLSLIDKKVTFTEIVKALDA